ncbi:radical SAM protein [Vibrio algarum]|uniref:Radical SAM protein n=1 Tax=Vibrio algarum TaxID=3020714 RepID=A0ABT4YM43_9VIBR|nr:radical SAM protein [Vibrio sp. KJ40-1]MDB1122248.1 radical SAM protein [Vibrio sp. KJ40-1]
MKSEITIDYMLTSKCNLKCPFCYGPSTEIADIEVESHKKILKGIKDSGVKKVIFAGGEPTLYRHFDEIINYACLVGLDVSIQTNASYPSRLIRLTDNFEWIAIPIDGVEDETQLYHRTSKKHFKRSIELIKKLNLSGFNNIKVGTVLTKRNIDEIPKIYEALSKFDIGIWKLYMLRPRGNAVNILDDVSIDYNYVKAVIDTIKTEHNNKFEIYLSNYTGNDNYLIVDPDSQMISVSSSGEKKHGFLMDEGCFDNNIFNSAIEHIDNDKNIHNSKLSFPGW